MFISNTTLREEPVSLSMCSSASLQIALTEGSSRLILYSQLVVLTMRQVE